LYFSLCEITHVSQSTSMSGLRQDGMQECAVGGRWQTQS
jgi:hypothetical protein